MSDLRLYIHIPFCLHKCPYCDFNSHVRSEPDWQRYQQALCAELRYQSLQPSVNQPVASIFFGGGTPSLAPPILIETVINKVAQYFGIQKGAEISLEANPGAAEAKKFKLFRSAGINRLSIGVQSFNDARLHWLERIHSADEAISAYQMARHAGFNNINIDLMYGLPNQTLAQWQQTLSSAILLEPEHISAYQLTVEPHTLLASRHANHPLALPNDDAALTLLHRTREQLTAAGYNAYEISNFSQPGFQCQHNDGYWKYDDYIGIGAGAAGKKDCMNGGIRRYNNLRTPEHYMDAALKKGNAEQSHEQLSHRNAAAEALWLGLRRTSGIQLTHFKARFGKHPIEIFPSDLTPWLDSEHLLLNKENLQLSSKGIPLADAIAVSLFDT
ncbi:MAG: radical SAM family heme chaperone HemW [Mariprofundaceae bacterium]